jgi:hypothetical protein
VLSGGFLAGEADYVTNAAAITEKPVRRAARLVFLFGVHRSNDTADRAEWVSNIPASPGLPVPVSYQERLLPLKFPPHITAVEA